MASYRLSLTARTDLREIYSYGFHEYGEAQAERYFAEILAQFERIAASPFLYPAVDHILEGYRQAVCGVHSIYCRIENDRVEIMRLLGRQNPTEAF